MAGLLDETVKCFVNAVFDNETLTDEERKQFILKAMLSLESKIYDGHHRRGQSMTLAEWIQDARQPRKKREASGFFGNWAKHHEENKKGDIDEFDVDEMGC